MNKLIMALALAGLSSMAFADLNDPNTDWMPGKVGAFLHWWPTEKNLGDWQTFDVQKLKAQLVAAEVDFFIFTLGQNSNYYNSPNDTYEELAGYKKGERCSQRDIPAEIIAALKGTGIRFGLYSPAQPSFNDNQAEDRFGFKRRVQWNADRLATDEGVKNWSKVLRVWAERYGKDVAIWWFDGVYEKIGYKENHGRMMREALKAGNPNMVMTFNNGSADWGLYPSWEERGDKDPTFAEKHPFRTWRYRKDDTKTEQRIGLSASDYIAGETEEPMGYMPQNGRWIEGFQYFILTYLGNNWSFPECRYPDDLWIPWLREYRAKGGCIAFDLGHDPKHPGKGVVVDRHINQLRRLIRATRPAAAK